MQAERWQGPVPPEETRMSIMGDAPKIGPRLLPIVVLAIVLTAIWPDAFGFLGPLARAGRAAGIVAAAVGLVFWGSAAVGLVRAYREDRLCTSGAYGLSRHPIFAWWVFFVLAPAALVFDSWLFLAAAALVAFALRPAMRAEEEYLALRYGEAHARYLVEVPALVPLPRLHPVTARRYGIGAAVALGLAIAWAAVFAAIG